MVLHLRAKFSVNGVERAMFYRHGGGVSRSPPHTYTKINTSISVALHTKVKTKTIRLLKENKCPYYLREGKKFLKIFFKKPKIHKP